MSHIKIEKTESDNDDPDIMTVMPTSPPSSPTLTLSNAEQLKRSQFEILPQFQSSLPDMSVELRRVFESFEITYPTADASYSVESCFSIDQTLYCANREARRERQRRVRFGIKFASHDLSQVERANQYQLRLGVHFTMPGVHSELQACGSHRQKFQTSEFFQLYTLDRLNAEKCLINEPGEQLPVLVRVTDVPLRRESDPFIFHFVFNCYTSCLNTLGDAKNTLKAVFFLLSSHDEVIQQREQKIRITANPGRDAKHVESLQSRKAMSALIKKETQMVRPLAPKTKNENKDKNDEPKDKKPKYTISMEEPIWSLLRALPLTEAVELQTQLEKMPPTDRTELVTREVTRLSFNLMLALNTYRDKNKN